MILGSVLIEAATLFDINLVRHPTIPLLTHDLRDVRIYEE